MRNPRQEAIYGLSGRAPLAAKRLRCRTDRTAEGPTTILSHEAIAALLQVAAIDLLMAGDNAVVIGLAAAGLKKAQRARAIFVGIMAATALRLLFAVFAIQLLEIVGLLLAGGILLPWVCWKMWRIAPAIFRS